MRAMITAVLALGFITASMSLSAEPASKPAPWLVAQADRPKPKCQVDGRDVPVGSTFCREGSLHVCDGRGTWSDSRKPC